MYLATAFKHNVSSRTLHLPVNRPPSSPSVSKKDKDRLISFLVRFANGAVPLTHSHLDEAFAIMVIGVDQTGDMFLLHVLCNAFFGFDVTIPESVFIDNSNWAVESMRKL